MGKDHNVTPTKSDSGKKYLNLVTRKTKDTTTLDVETLVTQPKDSGSEFKNFVLKKTKNRTPPDSRNDVEVTPTKPNDSGKKFWNMKLRKTKTKETKSMESPKASAVTPTRHELKKTKGIAPPSKERRKSRENAAMHRQEPRNTEIKKSLNRREREGITKTTSLYAQKNTYGTPTATKGSGNRKLLVLISSYMPTLKQRTSQDRAFTILNGIGISPDQMETVDGAMATNKEKRNELFGVSGIRAKYPQFFLVDDNQQTEFFADWEDFEAMNDSGILKETLVLA